MLHSPALTGLTPNARVPRTLSHISSRSSRKHHDLERPAMATFH